MFFFAAILAEVERCFIAKVFRQGSMNLRIYINKERMNLHTCRIDSIVFSVEARAFRVFVTGYIYLCKISTHL